jgi:hypothetical protein
MTEVDWNIICKHSLTAIQLGKPRRLQTAVFFECLLAFLKELYLQQRNPHNLTFIFHDNLAFHKSTAQLKEEALGSAQPYQHSRLGGVAFSQSI